MAVLALTVYATISAILIIPPLLVEIATDLDVSVAVAGQLATATFAGWAVMGISGGPLSDSFGRRPVALACLAVLSISVLASAFAPNLEILLALRVLTGLGGGALPSQHRRVGFGRDRTGPAGASSRARCWRFKGWLLPSPCPLSRCWPIWAAGSWRSSSTA